MLAASGGWVENVVVVGEPLLLVLAGHYDITSEWWKRGCLGYNLIDGAAWLTLHSATPLCGPKGAPSIPLLRPKSTPNPYGVSLWNPAQLSGTQDDPPPAECHSHVGAATHILFKTHLSTSLG